MSKKSEARSTAYYLRQAHAFISNAQESAEQTGDKNLHQKVTKLRNDLIEVRKDLETKLYES